MAKRTTPTPPAEPTGQLATALLTSNVPEIVSIVDTPAPDAGFIYSRFSDFDVHLFRAGKHQKLYEKFGSHVVEHNGVTGTYFAVWAPSARYVAVIGNFNGWDKGNAPMKVRWD